MEEKIKKFEATLLATEREGMDKLLEFIRKSDFLYGSSKHQVSFLP